jgi:hypothetical protein
MREQPPALCFLWLIPSGAKVNIVAKCEGIRIEVVRSRTAYVQPDVPETGAEPML